MLNQSMNSQGGSNIFNKTNAGFIFPLGPSSGGKVNLNSNFFSKNVFKENQDKAQAQQVDGVGKEKNKKQFLFAMDDEDDLDTITDKMNESDLSIINSL